MGAPLGESSAFVPVAWRSGDARTWTESVLPFGAEGGATGVTAIGGDLIAVGPGAPADLIWRSSDGGATWGLVPVEVPGVGPDFRLHDIATGRGVVMAIGSSLGPGAIGVGGRAVDRRRPHLGVGRRAPTASTPAGTRPGSRPGCPGSPSPPAGPDGRSVVLRSTNGDVWQELDLRQVVGIDRVDDVATHPVGPHGAVREVGDGSWSAWTWPDGPTPPAHRRPAT